MSKEFKMRLLASLCPGCMCNTLRPDERRVGDSRLVLGKQ